MAVFVERFLRDLAGKNELSMGEGKVGMRSHQLFEKGRSKSRIHEMLFTDHCPHNWAAEQATGEAVYLDDIRKLEGELQLVVIQSNRAHAMVKEY